MYRFPIGIILESFRKPIPEAVREAAALGAKGLQVYTSRTKMAFQEMTPQQRKDFHKLVNDNGLVFSALCGDLGYGFTHPEKNAALVDESKAIMDIALEMETDIVTTHIGKVPEDPQDPVYKILQDACGELAEYADQVGAHFAVETGPEPAGILCPFLDSLHSTGVAVNLDPANLVMCSADDPVAAVHTLKKYIVHTHAKDGKMLKTTDPEYETVKRDHIELPLGKGKVPFDAYLQALDAIGYKGFLTIEREVGEDPVGDIRMAVDFLNRKIG